MSETRPFRAYAIYETAANGRDRRKIGKGYASLDTARASIARFLGEHDDVLEVQVLARKEKRMDFEGPVVARFVKRNGKMAELTPATPEEREAAIERVVVAQRAVKEWEAELALAVPEALDAGATTTDFLRSPSTPDGTVPS